MRILLTHRDIFVLSGDARAMFMFADTFKYLGHDILLLYTDIRPDEDRYFTQDTLKEYHPVKLIDFHPVRRVGEPPKEGIVEGDFQFVENKFLSSRVYDYMIGDRAFDVFFTDQSEFMFWGDDVDFLKEIYYVHWTFRPKGPNKTTLWANSTYTKKAIEACWGRKDVYVAHPPLWVDHYYPTNGFYDRDIDVIMFCQLYTLKGLDIAEVLADKGFKVVVVGADVGDYDSDNITVVKNATVAEYTNLLSRSKVYIHGKVGEHFGITITEAMASGAVPVVHASGGPYLDIIDKGKYGVCFYNNDVIDKIKELTTNRNLWEKYHELAVDRVRMFDVPVIADTIAELLGEV